MEPKEIPFEQSGLANSMSDQGEATKDGMTNVDQSHVNSDVDSSQIAQHHTMGITQNQVNPGTHIHDGLDSRAIPTLIAAQAEIDALEALHNALSVAYSAHNHNLAPQAVPNITGIARAGWVPTWTANPGPNPTNPDALIGDWIRFGPIHLLTLWWKAGAATTFGTGFWQFTLPFVLTGVGSLNILNGMTYNGGKRYPIAGVLEAGKIDRIVVADSKAGGTPLLGNAGWGNPWASGDYFYLNGWCWAL